MEKEEKYKSSMWRITFWIFILLVIVLIGIFFEPINVKLNPASSEGRVIEILEWIDINNTPDFTIGRPGSNYNKTYNVTYIYTVDGKTYEGKRKMKLKWSLDPENLVNSDKTLGPADVAPIHIEYCKHWPSFHIVKD